MAFFDLPMTAGRNDLPVAIDEFGRPVYRDVMGNQYGEFYAQPEPQALPPMQGPRQDMARGDRARRRDIPANRNALTQAVGPIVNAMAQGFTAPGRALQGEPVTMGDAWATALDFGVMGAPMRAPEGALRAGGMRKGDGITAYHGSPHDFDRFSMDKIGTGEGAQAYGHGLYFAESEDVAQMYKRNLRFPALKGQPAADLVAEVADDINYYNGNLDAAESSYRAMAANPSPEVRALGEAKLAALDEASSRYKGSMYEVRINADPDDFLDWDAPLSEQPEAVRRAYAKAIAGDDEDLQLLLDGSPDSIPLMGLFPNSSGAQAYNTYADPARRGQVGIVAERMAADRAANELSQAGIPGIRYRDAGSRGLDGAEGTRNFVVFDENLIEIVRKYGIAGAATMLGVTAADVEEAMAGQ